MIYKNSIFLSSCIFAIHIKKQTAFSFLPIPLFISFLFSPDSYCFLYLSLDCLLSFFFLFLFIFSLLISYLFISVFFLLIVTIFLLIFFSLLNSYSFIFLSFFILLLFSFPYLVHTWFLILLLPVNLYYSFVIFIHNSFTANSSFLVSDWPILVIDYWILLLPFIHCWRVIECWGGNSDKKGGLVSLSSKINSTVHNQHRKDANFLKKIKKKQKDK